jgi:cytochrome c553
VLDRASLPAAELERGRQLVTRGDTALKVPACIACHGERLTGALPAIPGLVGLPRDYINAQFGAWRNGSRHALAPDCMGQIATRLSLADVSAISAWLASEPLPPNLQLAAQPAVQLPRPLPLACGSAPEHRP